MGAKVTVVTRSEESRDFIDGLSIEGVNTCLVKDASPGALHAINKQNGDVDGYFDAMILCTPEPGEFTKYLLALNQNIGAKVVIAGGSQGSADIHFRSHMVGEIDILLSRRYNAANFDKAARIVEEKSTVLRGMISEIAAPESGADLMLEQWKGAKGKAQINYIGER